MKFWLASFPRSGNTFFRNILYYVYGLESSTYHKETAYPVDENYQDYFAVKTHLLPDQIEPSDPNIPAVYLVRDGRDAMVSIAHHRKDIVSPGSDFDENLKEAIMAAEGSFFGGWSTNANRWIERADLILKYEDLIKDPVGTVERLRSIVEMPEAQPDKLPDFKAMKHGKPMYGGEFKMKDAGFQIDDFSKRFFRKGKSGGWREEMSEEFQDLFWNHHGDAMERLGYHVWDGSIGTNPELDAVAMEKLGQKIELKEERNYRILIEANKLLEPGNDGIKRYLVHLLKGFEELEDQGDGKWQFDLLHGQEIVALSKYKGVIQEFISSRKDAEEIVMDTRQVEGYESLLLGFKNWIKKRLSEQTYESIANVYRKGPARRWLKSVKQWFIDMRNYSARMEWKRKLEAYDLIHIPLPQNFEPFKKIENKFIVTVHDLTHQTHPEFHKVDNIAMSEAGMQFILARDAHCIAISESTKKDSKTQYALTDDKLHLVYESSDPENFKTTFNRDLATKVRDKYKLTDKAYFLCLSTIEPRKNLLNTIRAFIQMKDQNPEAELNLVIAGKDGWKTDHLYDHIDLDRTDIIFTGYIEDHDLSVLYSEALALCYISHYEGFGLPPIEAMSCRTPVIYGNNSSMPEVVGDAGLAADSMDIPGISGQMKTLFFDTELRERMSHEALRRSFKFTRRRMVFDTLQAYKKSC